jgi:hypothetical protein
MVVASQKGLGKEPLDLYKDTKKKMDIFGALI